MSMLSEPPLAALLVMAGAIPGAWLRFRLVEHLAPRLPRRHWGTLVVNLTASLVLGLLVALLGPGSDPGHRGWLLLLATGFCGSFSTFSTWVGELWSTLRAGEGREALRLALATVVLGLAAISIGLLLGQLCRTVLP